MYTLYIGAPNETHTLDERTMELIKTTISKYFESYTYVKARGVYKDTEEDTVMVTLANVKKRKSLCTRRRTTVYFETRRRSG